MKKNDVVFRITSFLSAFLLFSIQPLIIKYLLPYFGGSSATWIVGSLFFEATLLLGYVYATILLQLKYKIGNIIHIIFLLCVFALAYYLTHNWSVPILPPDNVIQPWLSQPLPGILTVLSLAIGLPFLMLSTTNTLLHWLYFQQFKKEPYFLYRISNTGSLLGLISYPFFIEPYLSLKFQALLWSRGFLLFVLLMIGVSIFTSIKLSPKPLKEKTQPKKSYPYALWIFLGMFPVIAMLSITNHLTQGISPVPFLWIMPLALYLVSFIVGFQERKYLYELSALAAFSATLLVVGIRLIESHGINLLMQVMVYLTYFFTISLLCHQVVYRNRPRAQELGRFYLSLTFGGFLGGFFVAIIVPLSFKTFVERDITIILGLLLSTIIMSKLLSNINHAWMTRKKVKYFLGVLAIVCILNILLLNAPRKHRVLYSSRDFYGALWIVEQDGFRLLYHGNILHGGQYLDIQKRLKPATYYHQDSGVEVALNLQKQGKEKIRVAIVGLGTGTLATYCRENDQYDFYEINPKVITLARTHFSYLTACQHQTIYEGDARIQIKGRNNSEKYDVIVLDAFSDDAIPIHLLTKEAFELYLTNLSPQGIIVVHISNRNLNLNPPLVRIAKEMQMNWVNIPLDPSIKISTETSPSEWVMLSLQDSLLQRVQSFRPDARDNTHFSQGELWTDDYSSIFPLLKYKF